MARERINLAARQTMAAEIAAELRRQIIAGELEPGTPLPQVQLARSYGISTTPVREALHLLRREGLVRGEAHERVVVFRPTLEDLRENSEMRIALETLATRLGVPQLGDAELGELKRLVDAMAATDPTDAEKYPPLNRAFHTTIYRAARRPRLLATIEDLRDAATGYLRIFANAIPDARSPQLEHEQIYEACLAHDAERAADMMAEHLRHTLDTVASSLEGRDGASWPARR